MASAQRSKAHQDENSKEYAERKKSRQERLKESEASMGRVSSKMASAQRSKAHQDENSKEYAERKKSRQERLKASEASSAVPTR
eukprot:g14300.t1